MLLPGALVQAYGLEIPSRNYTGTDAERSITQLSKSAYGDARPSTTNGDEPAKSGNALLSVTARGAGQRNVALNAGSFICSYTATTTASSNAVCETQPVVLTTQVSPAGSYTYSVAAPAGVNVAGGTTNTAIATNLNTGVNNFTITVTGDLGCITTNVVSVTASPTSILTLTASASAICVGESVNLSLAGVPLGGVITYGTQNPLTGQLLNPTISPVFSPTATTTYIASVNVLGLGGVTTLTSCPITVLVNQPPVVAPINLSLCVGASLDLTSLSGLAGLTNVFSTSLGTLLGTPTSVSIGTGVNLFNVTSTSPLGCTSTTPISVTGVDALVVNPINLSLCVGATLDLTSLSGLAGLTNVFSTSLGTLLGTPTSVSIGAGVNLFNVTSTSPLGCTTTTPISVTGVNTLVVNPINLSLCVGATLDLTSLSGLSGLAGLTNVFSTSLGTLLGTPTSVSIGTGVNLFNVTSTSPLGCTSTTPISVTGVDALVVNPINLSLCVGATLDLTSLSGLAGLTNVFSTSLGTLLGTPTSVSIGTGVNLFNVTSTSPLGCTSTTPISVTGVGAPLIAPINLSLCVGATLDLTSLSGLAGLTNVFSTSLGTLLGTPTSVSIGTGVNLFNVTSTSPLGLYQHHTY